MSPTITNRVTETPAPMGVTSNFTLFRLFAVIKLFLRILSAPLIITIIVRKEERSCIY